MFKLGPSITDPAIDVALGRSPPPPPPGVLTTPREFPTGGCSQSYSNIEYHTYLDDSSDTSQQDSMPDPYLKGTTVNCREQRRACLCMTPSVAADLRDSGLWSSAIGIIGTRLKCTKHLKPIPIGQDLDAII